MSNKKSGRPIGVTGQAKVLDEKELKQVLAYSTEFGQSFHLKLDTQSTANWTVGAKRR